jgi:hypothetical protein
MDAPRRLGIDPGFNVGFADKPNRQGSRSRQVPPNLCHEDTIFAQIATEREPQVVDSSAQALAKYLDYPYGIIENNMKSDWRRACAKPKLPSRV